MNIKDLASKYKLDDNDFWRHKQSGKWIITHDAVEKIADQENIQFDLPKIYADNNSDIAMVGCAKKGDKVVWTTGEASPKNCMMKYYWAMAEKRLKDRLTLTLIDVYGDIYSEIEADEFAAQHPQAGLKKQGEYGPPSEKQRKLITRLIEEKIPEDEKEKWYEKADSCEDTWDMSILIDTLVKNGK